ncbi:Arm DNA-binding domain-containing protein [Burkholderia diffusa]|uniref:Arm DNA-binding domain-containing protein n=1 Tax=Burkholderia diffusa TaxID=488732 RepID=UPI003F518368
MPPTDASFRIMPTRATPLTEMQVGKAKPAEKSYRLADGKGLYLEVMPNGSRYWRMILTSLLLAPRA